MPDLQALGLTEEGPVDVQWDAPESSAFQPRVWPGDMTVGFKLNEQEPFRAVEREDPPGSGARKKFLEVTWTAVIDPRMQPEVLVNQPAAGESLPESVDLQFQRTNFYRHPKRPISDGDDLIRHGGQRIEGGATNAARADALTAMDGRAQLFVGVGWDAYCKPCGDMGKPATVATYKRKGASVWPRGVDGKYELMAPCPGCGKKMYGRETVRQFKTKPEQTA